jgi:hypothetical protein
LPSHPVVTEETPFGNRGRAVLLQETKNNRIKRNCMDV